MKMFRRSPAGNADRPRLTRQERNAKAMATDHLHANLGSRTVQGGGILVAGHMLKIFLQLASLARLAFAWAR